MAGENVIGGNRLTNGQIQVVPASDITGKLAESSIANDNTGTLVDIINVDSSTKQVSASKLGSIPESKLSNDNTGNIASIINSDTSSTTINSGKLGSIPGSKLSGSVATSLLSGIIGTSNLPFTLDNDGFSSVLPQGITLKASSNVPPTISIHVGTTGSFAGVLISDGNLTTSDITLSSSSPTFNVASIIQDNSSNPTATLFFLRVESGTSNTSYTLTAGTSVSSSAFLIGVSY